MDRPSRLEILGVVECATHCCVVFLPKRRGRVDRSAFSERSTHARPPGAAARLELSSPTKSARPGAEVTPYTSARESPSPLSDFPHYAALSYKSYVRERSLRAKAEALVSLEFDCGQSWNLHIFLQAFCAV